MLSLITSHCVFTREEMLGEYDLIMCDRGVHKNWSNKDETALVWIINH